MDIRTIIETVRTVKFLKNSILNKRQRILLSLSKYNYLNPETSTDETQPKKYGQDHKIDVAGLLGYQLRDKIDLRIIKLV